MANEVCLDVALAAYPIPDDEDLDAATEEAVMPAQDDGHGRRLAGLPDRYNWANSDTHRCANEGGWCACDGNVGGDPFSGHDKQCFCHPRQTAPAQYDYVQKWTQAKCYQTCGRPGANWWSGDFWKGVWCGFSCTGTCPIRAAAFVAGREHTYPIEECAEFCYCVFKGWTG